jgi:DNA repair protein RadC
MKIKDLQREEKPREKLIDKGPEALTDTELLSIILRSGGINCTSTDLARNLINQFSGLDKLVYADTSQLISIPNVGAAKATGIIALGELAKRLTTESCVRGNAIKKPQDVFDSVKKEFSGKQEEHLYLISLDRRNKILSKDLVSKGTLTETLIHPREIFKKALTKNASSIILVHNHPSGEPYPSLEDVKVTKRIAKTGIEIGIPLMDHLVVTKSEFTSMKAQNLLN